MKIMSVLSYVQCLWQDLAYGQWTVSEWMHEWMLGQNSHKKLRLEMTILESSYIDPLAEIAQLNWAAQAESEEIERKGGSRKDLPGEDADRCHRSLYQGC